MQACIDSIDLELDLIEWRTNEDHLALYKTYASKQQGVPSITETTWSLTLNRVTGWHRKGKHYTAKVGRKHQAYGLVAICKAHTTAAYLIHFDSIFIAFKNSASLKARGLASKSHCDTFASVQSCTTAFHIQLVASARVHFPVQKSHLSMFW